ncbi:HMCN [Mytilus edulis]|uniref:HMCN n=1 Tax=Mytilus edulis TaxID=6550 RepID=A0A8S3QJV1_MYTED|nr:HMCN [Mytilus edulis]
MAQTSTTKCSLCETNNGMYFCYECKSALCGPCRKTHDKIPATQNHSITDLNRVDRSMFSSVSSCNTHKQEFSLYCTTCNILICSKCVATKHKGHDFSEIEPVVGDMRNSLKKQIKKRDEKLRKLSSVVDNIRSVRLKALREDAQQIRSKVHLAIQDIQNVIEKQKEIKITEIDDFEKFEKQELETALATKERVLNSFKILQTSLGKILDEEHGTTFLTSYKTMKSDFDEVDDGLQEINNYQIPSVSTKSVRKDVTMAVIQHFKKSINTRLCDENSLETDGDDLTTATGQTNGPIGIYGILALSTVALGKRSRNRVCQHCVQGRLYDSLTIGCDLEQNRRNIIDWSTTRNFLRDKRNKYKGTNFYLLKILNLQYTDNGKYRCSFWNGQKHNYGIFINLNVYGAPKVTILRQSHFVQIGTTVTFVCNIESNPAISELWWTDNHAKHITDKLRYNGGNIHNHNLSILSVKDSDSGVYTCNANNTEGTSKATTTLITGNITQTTILEDLYVAIDEQDITLECLIKTDPSNKMLYWLKNEKDLKPYLSSKYSGGTLSEQSLTIKNVDNNDAGNYTCKLENQFGTSEDVVELKVLYVPLVYQSSDTIKAFTGDTIQLKCVYESYPEPSVVFWTRDGEILNISVSKYNGSTINEPSLTIVNIDQFDSGAYVCAVVNNIGTGYSSKILLLIKEKVLTSADKVPVVVGTVLSVAVFLLILFTVLVLLMKRRRVKKNQESSYETNEMINAETHAYGKTDTYHDYCNSNMKQTPATKNDISLMEGDCLLKKYNVIELTNRLNNAESLEARIRAEFMFLETKSVKVDMATNDYEIVCTKKEAKTLYMKQSVDDIFIFSSFPDDRNVEQFWSMIINHHIENIIMIVQKSEKTTSFCPTHEDVFKVAMLEIEMRSAEKTNDNICMLRFILHDKKSRTKHHVKIFKTNWDDSDKYPPIENICSLLDKVKIEEGRPTLMTGSKGKSFSVCGAVSLCLQSVREIERETTFSLLEYATLLKRIEDDFIKVFEDYEFCYKVMAQYLETIHTYSIIE